MVVIVLLKNWWWTKIKIRAIDENGNQVGNAVEVNGSNTPRNYNFYCQQYFFQNSKSECTNVYNGRNIPKPLVDLVWNNKCEDGKKLVSVYIKI